MAKTHWLNLVIIQQVYFSAYKQISGKILEKRHFTGHFSKILKTFVLFCHTSNLNEKLVLVTKIELEICLKRSTFSKNTSVISNQTRWNQKS